MVQPSTQRGVWERDFDRNLSLVTWDLLNEIFATVFCFQSQQEVIFDQFIYQWP
jgi:hypothetical protein